MPPTIPERPDDLTPAWLTGALAASAPDLLDGAAVTGVDVAPVGTGQMSDSLRLTLRYDRPCDAPATLVAKLAASDPTSRATAKQLGSYENEVRFYQQLAPALPVRTPQALHAAIDVEEATFVLLLEDMAPARPGDQLAGCTPPVAAVAVDELVHLHAPRWGDPKLAALPWLHRDREAGQQFLLTMLPVLWDGFRARYAADLGPDVYTAGNALFGAFEAYVLADTEPWTVVHGDYRLDNLLFDPAPDGTPIAVVDWQTCAHGPAAQDVAYFVGAGLHPEDRRTHEDELARRYHDALTAAGVADYPWDRFWRDYRRSTWAGLVMAVAASMLVERTDRGDRMFLTMAERHSRHALDLDAPETLTA
ncbi:MAG TPA: phosphotransferase [Acidimicrobiales bacterium]